MRLFFNWLRPSTVQVHLRSKKESIEKFILDNLPKNDDSGSIPDHFDSYWGTEKQNAFATQCKEEGLAPTKFDVVIKNYLFSGKRPLRDNIIGSLESELHIPELLTP